MNEHLGAWLLPRVTSDRRIGSGDRARRTALLDEHSGCTPVPSRWTGGGFLVDRGYCLACRESSPCTELRQLGALYDDQPGYREEWRP